MLLICTFEINSRIDTEVKVDGIWRRGGELLNNHSRVNITELILIDPSTYQTTLSISPLSDVLDSGQYTCQTDFTSDSFVLFTDAYQQVIVRIEGNKNILLLCQQRCALTNVTFCLLGTSSITITCCNNY